jgi:glucokinase
MTSYVLGIDLGGTKVSAGVLDPEGNIIGRARAKTKAWRDSDSIFRTIATIGHRALEKADVEANSLMAIGIGSPGPLDPDTGYIIDAANLNFVNFPLGPRLIEEFGCPTVVANDVDAGTYGEFKAGAARDASDVLGVFVGTGIGGGVIANGALYRGFSENAGEIGHVIIKANGPRCGCGNRGCLEALASRLAIARDLRKAVKRGQRTSVARELRKKENVIPSNVLKHAYDAGDRVVIKVMRRAAEYLGMAVGSMVNMLGPEVVVLGGGVIEAFGDTIIDMIDETARDIAFEFAIKDVRIVEAALGDDSVIVGAAMLAIENLGLSGEISSPAGKKKQKGRKKGRKKSGVGE